MEKNSKSTATGELDTKYTQRKACSCLSVKADWLARVLKRALT